MTVLGPVVLLAVIALVVMAVLKLLLKKQTRQTDLPYVAVASLLTRTEQHFFAALTQAVNGRYWIFPKVALDDILEVRQGLSYKERQGALNRINRKHVDFVLCTPEDYKVRVLVELDDSSHQRSDRKARDRFVDDAAKAAGLHVAHVKAASSYDPEGLSQIISDAIAA